MALQIDPVTGLQNSTVQPRGVGAGQDISSVDFMTLIITQLRNQNPLDPQSDSDFMAQMAQFEALNQMKAVAEGIKVVQSLNELSSATGLIGHNVIGRQVNAIGVTRDLVSRELFGQPFAQLVSGQRVSVNQDERVVAAAADVPNAGREVAGVVDKVVVGPDGIPMLWIGDKVVDLFTVAEVD
jgi:flagellar basal-body rod modification protein FlgD